MTNKFSKLRVLTPAPIGTPTRLFLSENSKTGMSINVSIARSCRPTSACKDYCYGLESRIIMPASLVRHADNFARFQYLEHATDAEVKREAIGVAYIVQARQNFLRFFGVGDLQPGSVRFINTMAQEVPEMAFWVATRKFDLAKQLLVLPNLNVMMSLDHSTKGAFLDEALSLRQERAPQFYTAWVQVDQTPPPAWADLVFAEHHKGVRAKFTKDGQADARTCPATVAGGNDHESACANCRFCFTTSIRSEKARKLASKLKAKRAA